MFGHGDSSLRRKKSLRPKKNSNQTLELKLQGVSMGVSGNFEERIKVPKGEILNEWFAINVVDFFNNIAIIISPIETTLMNDTRCMCAGPYEYYHKDDRNDKYKKPTRLNPDKYIILQLDIIEERINDPIAFPPPELKEYPPNYKKIVKDLFKRLFRIYAHLILEQRIAFDKLGMLAHVNTLVKHFIHFVVKFRLVRKQEFGPLLQWMKQNVPKKIHGHFKNQEGYNVSTNEEITEGSKSKFATVRKKTMGKGKLTFDWDVIKKNICENTRSTELNDSLQEYFFLKREIYPFYAFLVKSLGPVMDPLPVMQREIYFANELEGYEKDVHAEKSFLWNQEELTNGLILHFLSYYPIFGRLIHEMTFLNSLKETNPSNENFTKHIVEYEKSIIFDDLILSFPELCCQFGLIDDGKLRSYQDVKKKVIEQTIRAEDVIFQIEETTRQSVEKLKEKHGSDEVALKKEASMILKKNSGFIQKISDETNLEISELQPSLEKARMEYYKEAWNNIRSSDSRFRRGYLNHSMWKNVKKVVEESVSHPPVTIVSKLVMIRVGKSSNQYYVSVGGTSFSWCKKTSLVCVSVDNNFVESAKNDVKNEIVVIDLFTQTKSYEQLVELSKELSGVIISYNCCCFSNSKDVNYPATNQQVKREIDFCGEMIKIIGKGEKKTPTLLQFLMTQDPKKSLRRVSSSIKFPSLKMSQDMDFDSRQNCEDFMKKCEDVSEECPGVNQILRGFLDSFDMQKSRQHFEETAKIAKMIDVELTEDKMDAFLEFVGICSGYLSTHVLQNSELLARHLMIQKQGLGGKKITEDVLRQFLEDAKTGICEIVKLEELLSFVNDQELEFSDARTVFSSVEFLGVLAARIVELTGTEDSKIRLLKVKEDLRCSCFCVRFSKMAKMKCYCMVYIGWLKTKGVHIGRVYGEDQRNSLIFEGEFVNGVKQGVGKEFSVCPKSVKDEGIYCSFHGEYRNGERNGKGMNFVIYKKQVMAEYEGEWKGGKRHGRGEVHDFENDQYILSTYKHGILEEETAARIDISYFDWNKIKKLIPKAKFLGKGGFGSVYMVKSSKIPGLKNKTTDKMCAVKVMQAEDNDNLDDLEYGLKRGIICVSRVKDQTNLLKTYGIFKDYETFKVGCVMECCDHDVCKLIGKKLLKMDQKLKLLLELSKAVKGLHDLEIMHRDLKWGNVLIRTNPDTLERVVKLTDFDTLKENEQRFRMSTVQMTSRIGTSGFVAPEVYSGQKYGIKCDIFSLGIMMASLVTDTLNPYSSQTECSCGTTFQNMLDNCNLDYHISKCNFRPRIEKTEYSHVPDFLIEIMKQCVAPDPSARPTIDDVVKMLNTGSSGWYSIVRLDIPCTERIKIKKEVFQSGKVSILKGWIQKEALKRKCVIKSMKHVNSNQEIKDDKDIRLIFQKHRDLRPVLELVVHYQHTQLLVESKVLKLRASMESRLRGSKVVSLKHSVIGEVVEDSDVERICEDPKLVVHMDLMKIRLLFRGIGLKSEEVEMNENSLDLLLLKIKNCLDVHGEAYNEFSVHHRFLGEIKSNDDFKNVISSEISDDDLPGLVEVFVDVENFEVDDSLLVGSDKLEKLLEAERKKVRKLRRENEKLKKLCELEIEEMEGEGEVDLEKMKKENRNLTMKVKMLGDDMKKLDVECDQLEEKLEEKEDILRQIREMKSLEEIHKFLEKNV